MKTFNVRVYTVKFVDVEVQAKSAEEAADTYELPHLDWWDDNDTAVDMYCTEVTELGA